MRSNVTNAMQNDKREGEYLPNHLNFKAKSNSLKRGGGVPAWKAGTLPTELLPQNHSYFSSKFPSCQKGYLLCQNRHDIIG